MRFEVYGQRRGEINQQINACITCMAANGNLDSGLVCVSRLIHKIEAKCSLNEIVALTLPWQPRPQLNSAILPSYKLATGLTTVPVGLYRTIWRD